MAGNAAPGFGGLLRRLRDEAGLTQEELAEAAGLSPRSVSDLERGINQTARKDTARLLADALSLSGPQRALFAAAARGRTAAAIALAAQDTLITGPNNLPLQPTRFVGRDVEIAAVRQTLATSRLVTLTGPGGIGKSRLAMQAAAGLPAAFPDGLWWVALAGTRDAGQVPGEANMLRARHASYFRALAGCSTSAAKRSRSAPPRAGHWTWRPRSRWPRPPASPGPEKLP